MRPHRLAWSRTPDFHSGNRGSNPLGDAKISKPPFFTTAFFMFERGIIMTKASFFLLLLIASTIVPTIKPTEKLLEKPLSGFISLPRAKQEEELASIPRDNPDLDWRSYLCWNAQLCPQILPGSIHKEINTARIMTILTKSVESGLTTEDMMLKYAEYINAYNRIEEEFFTKKRPFTTLTIEDLQIINGLMVGQPEGISPLRTRYVSVLRYPFNNTTDFTDPDKIAIFGKLTKGEQTALAYAEKQKLFERTPDGKEDGLRDFVRRSPDMRSAIIKVYDGSPPQSHEAIVTMLNKALDAIKESTMHPIALAAYVFDTLCLTHPFEDANGRTALLIANLILVQSGYLPILCGATEYNKAFADVLKTVEDGCENHDAMIKYFMEQTLIMSIFDQESVLTPADIVLLDTTGAMRQLYSEKIHPREEAIRRSVKIS